MVMIRLQRVGRRNHAEFRVVVIESTRGPKSADFIENVGAYNPHTNAVTLNKERITYWLGTGATPSDTVHNLLVKEGVIEGKKRNVLPKKSAPVVEAPKEEAKSEAEKETSSDEAPAEEETTPAETTA